MAQRTPIVIDGETRIIDEKTKLSDLVPQDVQSIVTRSGALISRDQFALTPVPEGFDTNLSAINKG